MALVNAICTSCSKTVEVDSTKDAWVCPHCSTPFIVDKAIRKYRSEQYIRQKASKRSKDQWFY